MGARALKIGGDHAVIPDEREGLHHDLPVIARVGERFKVSRHAGGEHQLAHGILRRAAAHAGEHLAVFQNQVTLLHPCLLYIKTLQAHISVYYTSLLHKNKEKKSAVAAFKSAANVISRSVNKFCRKSGNEIEQITSNALHYGV